MNLLPFGHMIYVKSRAIADPFEVIIGFTNDNPLTGLYRVWTINERKFLQADESVFHVAKHQRSAILDYGYYTYTSEPDFRRQFEIHDVLPLVQQMRLFRLRQGFNNPWLTHTDIKAQV